MPCAFIKDPATADTILATLTDLGATAVCTRTSSAYNPATDTFVLPDVARTMVRTVGTTSLTYNLTELTRTNILATGTSSRFDQWTAAAGLTTTADSHASPAGDVIAQTLTDPGGSLSSAKQTFTVANDSLPHVFGIYVLKTAGGTAPTFGVTLALTGGTGVTTNARINTDTGAQQYGSNANTYVETSSAGTWYRVVVLITNNTSGNTTLTLDVYPAAAAYGAGSDSAAATGSAICCYAELCKAGFATSYTDKRNCIINTENFGTTWTPVRATVTDNTTANPFNSNVTADTIVEDGTLANTHGIRITDFTKAASSIQFTFSVYVLASGRSWILVICNTNANSVVAGAGKYFDVGTGALGTAVASVGWTLDNSTITSAGAGWYRCRITFTSDTTTFVRCQMYTSTGDVLAIHNGDSNPALIIYGAQLVYGATDQDYVAVGGSVGTRSAELLTYTGTISTTEGSIVAFVRPYGWGDGTNAVPPGQAGTPSLWNSNATSNDCFSNNANVGRTDAGGANTVSHGETWTRDSSSSVVLVWTASAVTSYGHGIFSATDATLSAPFTAVSGITIGNISTGARNFDAWIWLGYRASLIPASSVKILCDAS